MFRSMSRRSLGFFLGLATAVPASASAATIVRPAAQRRRKFPLLRPKPTIVPANGFHRTPDGYSRRTAYSLALERLQHLLQGFGRHAREGVLLVGKSLVTRPRVRTAPENRAGLAVHQAQVHAEGRFLLLGGRIVGAIQILRHRTD